MSSLSIQLSNEFRLLLSRFPFAGDFDGSDNDYDDDNNEYGNSDAKEYGCQHWERKTQTDVPIVKEEKVCVGMLTFYRSVNVCLYTIRPQWTNAFYA